MIIFLFFVSHHFSPPITSHYSIPLFSITFFHFPLFLFLSCLLPIISFSSHHSFSSPITPLHFLIISLHPISPFYFLSLFITLFYSFSSSITSITPLLFHFFLL
ncbi:hypothetical protein C1646_715015, partial [Rhizophagus diaphanus]